MPEPEAGAATAVATAEATESQTSPAEAVATSAPSDAAQAEQDPYALLSTLDPDELIRRHPKLQGKLGALAQQQAQKQAQAQIDAFRAEQARLQQIQQEQAKLAELEALARQDPESPLSQKVLTDTTMTRAQQQRQQEWQKLQADMAQGIRRELEAVLTQPEVVELYQRGDENVRKRLDFNNYGSMKEFIIGVGKVLAEAEVEAKAEELASARLKAKEASAKIAAATNGAERPDLGLGSGAPNSRVFSRSDIKRMSRAEFAANEAEIDRQAAAGLIIDDIGR